MNQSSNEYTNGIYPICLKIRGTNKHILFSYNRETLASCDLFFTVLWNWKMHQQSNRLIDFGKACFRQTKMWNTFWDPLGPFRMGIKEGFWGGYTLEI